MKKILVLSSSARKGGNSDSLADEFIRCVQKDDILPLYDKFLGADVIVFASVSSDSSYPS